MDAVDRADRHAPVAAAAQLRNDHRVPGVTEDGAEAAGARADALVTVDALRPVDPQRRRRPFGLPLPRDDPLGSGRGRHARERTEPSRTTVYDPGAPIRELEARVAKYPFLSDEWFAAVKQLVEDHGADAPAQANITMNLTVTDTPFGDERRMHMGAKDGRGQWGVDHEADADVTLTTDYATAKEVFVAGDPAAGMQAFMSGKVKVQGDMAKLMAAQAGGGGNPALTEAIQGITE
jgi:hypothetical protein